MNMGETEFPYPDLDDLDNVASRKPAATFRRPRKPRLTLRVIVAIVVLLIVLGGGGYWYAARRHHAPAKPANATQPAAPKPAAATSGTTLHYVSSESNLNLSFNYPSTWTVTPATNTAAGTQPITVTSPLTTIPSAAGGNVTGKAVIDIRSDSSQASELNSGAATAAQAPVQYAYAAPAADQHQYFYVGFVHLSAGANPAGGFEEAIITGIVSIAQGQAVTPDTISGVAPIISASFYACNTQACSGTGATRLSITADTWNNAALFGQIQSIFESLQLN